MLKNLLSVIIMLPTIGNLPIPKLKINIGIADSKRNGKQRIINLGTLILQLPLFLYSLRNDSNPSNNPMGPHEIKLIKRSLLKLKAKSVRVCT
ncbi:hypothetical protein KGF45_18635 [Clostridioides sp. ZZV14-6154]|uniref:hypothetical protein n=1 Tax=Clostridioides sp. ZZV14-6154 TaxID=2811495 RepID=UPI001D12B121|nr:hypothetical protein [Clostridioides sp. ZZV14-6154]